VEMVGTADVVTGSNSDELSSAVGIGGLKTTESVILDLRSATITVTLGDDTSVDTLRFY